MRLSEPAAPRALRIAQLGTFDVENYGDLLFPLIARAELGNRLPQMDLELFSYRTRSLPTWPYLVTSIAELPRLASRLDGLLIGGGHLIRFDKRVAPGYAPPTPEIHHPTGYWLTPALIALQHGVPLVWNAPGAAADIPPWAGPLLQLVLRHSAYIAVRDQPAHAGLSRFVDPAQIAVVPDTGFGVARLLPPEPSPEFERLRADVGLRGPYLVLQAAPGLQSACRYLKRHARELAGLQVLALPIGPALGDDPAQLDPEVPGLVRLPSWPPPLLVAELIRDAEAVIGYSYHLAITALCFGVPVFARADLVAGKYAALEVFATIYPLPDEADPDASGILTRLGRQQPSPEIAGFLAALAGHWDRVAAAFASGSTTTGVAVGAFLQALPSLLEGASDGQVELTGKLSAAQRHNEELGALLRSAREQIGDRDHRQAELEGNLVATKHHNEKLASLLRSAREQIANRDDRLVEFDGKLSAAQGRKEELAALLRLARDQIVERDKHVAALLASTSWRLTYPMRFIGRLLGR